MSPLHLCDWEEAKSVLGGLHSHIFRGLRDPKWKLESLLERQPWVKQFRGFEKPIHCGFIVGAYEDNRDNYLATFCEAEPMHTDSKEATDDELWAQGRHYGLITPFLDWTKNWRVAAFFALSDWVGWIQRLDGGDDPNTGVVKQREAKNPNACVWALALKPSPFAEGEFRFIETIPESESFRKRQAAQEGVYTQILTGRHFDVEAYLQQSGKIHYLRQYLIPGCRARQALNELSDEGIDYARLFPDPGGCAKHSNFLSLVRGFGESLSAMTERVERFRARTHH